MNHWTEFLTFAICHVEAMKYTQVSIDGTQILQAMQAAAAQAQQARSVLAAPTRFDPALLNIR